MFWDPLCPLHYKNTATITEHYNILTEYDNRWTYFVRQIGVVWRWELKHKNMFEKERVFDFLQVLNRDIDEVRGQLLCQAPANNPRSLVEVRREESYK